MKKSKLIIGLGNPGEKYSNSRHNAGFLILEEISKKLGFHLWKREKKVLSMINKIDFDEKKIELMKPETFMNLSGMAVKAWQQYYRVENIAENILVIYDDLDLPFGSIKLTNSSPKGHNGIISIQNTLGIDDFKQLRIGIDDRKGERSLPASDYVLQSFSASQLACLKNEITPMAIEKIKQWL